MTINKRLQIEPIVEKCKGLPKYLILLANQLWKHPFNEIEVVEKQKDKYINKPIHHKAKSTKSMVKVSFQHKYARGNSSNKKYQELSS